MKQNNISTIWHDKCFGCLACYHICPVEAIEVRPDDKGFLHPVLNQDKCVKCGKCISVCPAFQSYSVDGGAFQQKFYSYQCIELSERMKSKSGGAFWALANKVISDGGIVYGVAHTKDFDVRHIRVDNIEKLDELRGSKYVQSEMSEVYAHICQDLKRERMVLVSGTSCQIHALKLFLKSRDVDMRKLICCDLVCHGIPSPKVFKEYMGALQKRYRKKIIRFYFRSKMPYGWGRERECVEFEDGSIVMTTKYDQLDYFMLVYKHEMIRECCFNCPYCNFNRVGDISLADFWGVEYKHPELKDSAGTSLVIINSLKGSVIFSGLENCRISEVSKDECIQPNLIRPSSKLCDTDIYWEKFINEGIRTLIKLDTPTLKNRLKLQIKTVLKGIRK